MYVVDAVGKHPYADDQYPPYAGRKNPPVQPKNGHFDHLKPGTREVSAACAYATVRRVLDIWEDYFGRHIPWHFRRDYARLELIPRIEYGNSFSGYGYVEYGYGTDDHHRIDHVRPDCENFDLLAHELGHSFIFSVVGDPKYAETDEFAGFHESAGDLTAIVAVLHFNTIVDHLLLETAGNLFSVNELSRVGEELSTRREVRRAFNNFTMRTVPSREEHDLSLPLTGAIFDVLVEVFKAKLVAVGAISQDLADRAEHDASGLEKPAVLEADFVKAYKKPGAKAKFREALLDARDYLGSLLAHTWPSLDPNGVRYTDVAVALIDADQAITEGRHAEAIRECFAWREIKVPRNSPRLRPRLVRPPLRAP